MKCIVVCLYIHLLNTIRVNYKNIKRGSAHSMYKTQPLFLYSRLVFGSLLFVYNLGILIE